MSNTTKTVALGRPVNPNSARQKRLAELAEKRANGECKRGRPIVEGSERQQRLAKYADKVNSGIELKRGRPVNPNSARQQKLNKATAESASFEAAVKAALETKHLIDELGMN